MKARPRSLFTLAEIQERGRKALQRYLEDPDSWDNSHHLKDVMDLDVYDQHGELGPELFGQMLQALHQHEGETSTKRLYLLGKAVATYSLEAFLDVPWEDAHQAGVGHLLPQSDILARLISDENFTGTVRELIELAELLGAQGGTI